jgi:predicted dehydrogenase
MSRLRIGIVGLGWWACDVHIPNLLQLPDAELAALCSRRAENRQRGLDAVDGRAEPRLVESVPELLDCDDVDAVILCTPNATHAELTLEALRAGKHVYVEKPLALDPESCAAIAGEAKKRGLTVQVGVELRFADVVRAMRQSIRAGDIGEPVLLRTELWRQWNAPHGWRSDDTHGCETLHELAVHYLDLLGAVATGPPAWVTAAGGAQVTGHQPDHALLTVGYAGGAVGSVGLCLFAAGAEDAIPLEVVGTEGRLVGEILGGSLRGWTADGEERDLWPQRSEAPVFGFPGSLECLEHFVRSVREGRSPEVDAAEGERLCRLCDAARRSLGGGGRRISL